MGDSVTQVMQHLCLSENIGLFVLLDLHLLLSKFLGYLAWGSLCMKFMDLYKAKLYTKAYSCCLKLVITLSRC